MKLLSFLKWIISLFKKNKTDTKKLDTKKESLEQTLLEIEKQKKDLNKNFSDKEIEDQFNNRKLQ